MFLQEYNTIPHNSYVRKRPSFHCGISFKKFILQWRCFIYLRKWQRLTDMHIESRAESQQGKDRREHHSRWNDSNELHEDSCQGDPYRPQAVRNEPEGAIHPSL